jgi:uncharacterized protein
MLTSLVVPIGAGCARESKPPAVSWHGRCASRDPSSVVAAVSARDGLKDAPRPASLVTDQAEVLDSAFEAQMSSELEAFHAETCHQLAVVTVKSLNGQSVEDYSLALSNQVGFGYRDFNNGVMLLLAPNEHKARIEVGCGLEDAISNQAASEIMRDSLVPEFRKGDFAAGTRAGLRALMKRARTKQIPTAKRPVGCPQKAS